MTRAISLSLCLLLALLAACVQEEKKQTRPLVGVLLYNAKDPYVEAVGRTLKRHLEDVAEVRLLYADNRQSLQEEQLAQLLQAGVAALALNMVEPHRAGLMLEKISAQGLPVVFFNREPDIDVLKNYAKAAYVGTEARQAGELQGEIIHRLWTTLPTMDRNGDGIIQYILLHGNADSPEALQRTEHSVRRAVELGVPMRQLGPNHICNWDENLAHESTRLALASLKDSVELILSNNDAMALGAIRALNEVGFNMGKGTPTIPVIGVDAIDKALDAISQGRMHATVKQDGDAMGKAVAALILNSLKNKAFLEDTPYEWDRTGESVRIPYSLVEE